ncbi:ribosome-recycling factor-like [Ciona intestinalis]
MSLLCQKCKQFIQFRYVIRTLSQATTHVHVQRLIKSEDILTQPVAFTLSIPSLTRQIHTTTFLRKSKSKKGKTQMKIREVIRPRDAEEVLDLLEVENEMKKCVLLLQDTYTKEFKVGADLSIFEQMTINIENDRYPLNEIGQVSKPTQRMIVVDMESFPQYIKEAEAVIRDSNMNLNPNTTGTLIKVAIPQVTAEHRQLVAKKAKERLNLCNDKLRNIKAINEKLAKNHEGLTENLEHGIKEQLSIYLEHYKTKAMEVYKAKEKELLHPA